MMNLNDEEAYPKTLYVGNLDPNVSESLILELFNVIGPCKSCKMIAPDIPGGDPYCFVEFFDHALALAAHGAMNGRKILGKEIRVNWATRPSAKKDTSNHHHIFVGDLSPETTSEDLKNYFSKVGKVSDARVMRDATTNKSKGYGFVSFINYQDAQDIVEKKTIIQEALHGRQVRCNWAARKMGPTAGRTFQKLDYTTVVNQSSPNNCTVYLGGCMSGLTEHLMRETFAGFGNILEIRVFPDKGYSFIRFDTHNDAAQAITAKHGSQLEGYTIKCSWGKEGAGMPGVTMGTGYTNGMSQPSMDSMQMTQWSPAGTDMWGQQNQQYNQWTAWRNPAQQQQQQPQQQQQQQQQQSSWNTWAPNQQNNTWAPNQPNNTWAPNSMTTNSTWAPNNTSQPSMQQNSSWGWPSMGQQGQQQQQQGQQQQPQQPQQQAADGWGNSNIQQQQANGDGMWNNWTSQGLGNLTQQNDSHNTNTSMGSGDPGMNSSSLPTNGFPM
ncbi:nucleolysin TIAR-like [Clavelina lepadiformis]|uniref:nucleolysin TIAR-like n=1 Tax=Clavelina lepadiformis TaxID=159417 RepID=UPI0040429993